MREEEKMATWGKMVVVGSRRVQIRELGEDDDGDSVLQVLRRHVGDFQFSIFIFILFFFHFRVRKKERKKTLKNIYFPWVVKKYEGSKYFLFYNYFVPKIYKKENLRMILFIYFSF